MNYIVCEKPGTFKLKEKEEPVRNAGEALLRVKMVGICGTDLHAYAGNQAFFTYPRILGHELAAEVIDIDSNINGIRAGDHVVVMPYISCKKCIACRSGKTNCCTSLEVIGIHSDGGMQEKITLPADLLIPAKKLTFKEMAIVEPLAIGAHAIRRASLQSGETIVVIGCGPIGIGIMKLAHMAGIKVIAMDVNQLRLDYAKDKIGVHSAVMANEDAVNTVHSITGGDMATAVFDATGNKKALESGPDFMAFGGRYILVGLYNGSLVFNHPAIHAKETTVMCSRNATLEDFEQVISILEKKEFPVDSFITHEVGFKDMIAHFDDWLDPVNGIIKATVSF